MGEAEKGSMLPAKIQDHQTSGSRVEDLLRILRNMGMEVILVV